VTDTRRAPHAPLVLLAVCVCFAICTEMLPVGLLPEIGRGLGVSSSDAGVLVSLYAVLVAVMSVPIAAIAERWPRRVVLAVLLGASTLSNLVFAVAPDFAVAVVARTIGGLAHAASRCGRRRGGVARRRLPIGTRDHRRDDRQRAGPRPRRPARDGARHRPRLAVGIRRPAVLLVATVITLLALGHFTLSTYVSPLLQHDGVARADVGAVLFGHGCGGLLGLAVAGVVVIWRPDEALATDIVLMCLSLVLAAAVASTIGIVAVVAVWGALVNATTDIGIAGGALLGSRLLGVVAVPELGWVGAGLVAASLVVYSARLRRAR
jgi:predicted MFS family arabinose efflux permease